MRGGKWTFRGIHLYKCTKRWKRNEIQNWNVSFQQRVQRVHVVHKKNDHSNILNSVFIRQSNFVGFHSSCFSFVWFWFCFIELQLYMHGFLYPEVKQSVNIDGVCLLLCSLLMTNGFWDDRNKFVHTLVAQFFPCTISAWRQNRSIYPGIWKDRILHTEYPKHCEMCANASASFRQIKSNFYPFLSFYLSLILFIIIIIIINSKYRLQLNT